MIQAQAGVYKSIKPNSSVMGSPAINYIDFNKAYVHFKNLPLLMKSIQKLLKNNKDA
jgi:UDP-3-O-[3-hydroxymyristoyl] glucosamine N-acyltransferase